MLATCNRRIYTSRIIKAGALLDDTITLFAFWDLDSSVQKNLERFQSQNLFAKASRSRVEDILAVFHRRYLSDPMTLRALVAFVRAAFPKEYLKPILYFHTARADPLIYDVATQFLYSLYRSGRKDVIPLELERLILRWSKEGKTTTSWSQGTIRRVTQGLLATLRDFGILEGEVKKRISPARLPLFSFAYLAFYLWRETPSGRRILESSDWHLFFLSPRDVEQLFLEAHQHGLLEYQAAGSVIRIDFPAASLEEYAYALAERAH
ncbi:MAG TPA: DUF1819 family protein [Candidatus Acetothermia bacterium]|nr:MAG: hypothetical protein DRG83_18115 [Deltaproteobacteria bacterium]HDN19842.1 DUF1819 family protein [Candidatus Acetothermia bacterium]